MSFGPIDDPYALIKGLRVVRRFRDEPVADDHLRRILEAGRWTGSAKNTQPWAFIVVTDPEQRRRLVDCGHYTGPLRDAPLIIAPVRLPEAYEWDMGRVAQNMMLAGRAFGVVSCPVTLHKRGCGEAVLGVPEGHEVRYVLAFGYPDEEKEKEQRQAAARAFGGGRKPLAELVHHDRWSS